MSLSKARNLVLIALALSSVSSFAANGPIPGAAFYTGAALGSGMLTVTGPAAENLYRDMKYVKPELIDLGKVGRLFVRYGQSRGFGCIQTQYAGEKTNYACVVSFDDVATGQPVDTASALRIRR